MSAALDHELLLKPEIARQGKCFSITVTSAEGFSEIEGRFLGQNFSCYKKGNFFQGIIGVLPEQKPGNYPLSLTMVRDDGAREKRVISVKVSSARFPYVSFWLKPSKKKLFTQDLIAQEWARIEKALLVEPEQKVWAGRFALPAKGPTSMVFGTVERVNGKPTGRHRGHDIAVPMGTRVFAANNGRVVFAEQLKAFGGTIVMDHGQGIHTLYFHLSKFLAAVGQEVSRGEVIALSGNSGISSGPHLHWGMSVHNLRVDPVQWTKYAF